MPAIWNLNNKSSNNKDLDTSDTNTSNTSKNVTLPIRTSSANWSLNNSISNRKRSFQSVEDQEIDMSQSKKFFPSSNDSDKVRIEQTVIKKVGKFMNDRHQQENKPPSEVTSKGVTTLGSPTNKKSLPLHSGLSVRRCRFNGLVNQGATCYMNSILQIMFFTNYLRKAIYNIWKPNDRVISSLQHLFYELQFGDKTVQTNELTKAFEWNRSEIYNQQDVQEFCRVLFNKLELGMNDTKNKGTIPILFSGQMQTFIKCLNVDYESSKKETFYDLSLTVEGMKDVYDSLDNYVKVEELFGDNKYEAGKYGKQDAEKEVSFVKFPPFLHLHLLRFRYDTISNVRYKVNNRFEFPQSLNLNKYLDDEHGKNHDFTYVLQSVLVHSGDSTHGHYTVFINTGLGEGNLDEWHRFDDSSVSLCTPKEAVQDNYGSNARSPLYQSARNAYMLVYVQENKIGKLLRPINKGDVVEELRHQFEQAKEDNLSFIYL